MYSGLGVTVGESVELLCNTSLSADIMWTYDNDDDDGYVHYVYWNRRFDKRQFSVKVTSIDSHSFVISSAQLKDSGLYNCYDGKGQRKAGYRLSVVGM